jgi:3-oxoacyl-[acyl-carrier-protein] synthase III
MKTKVPVGIRSLGRFLPQDHRTMTSAEGSDVRVHVAAPKNTTYKMGAEALLQALDRAGLQKEDLKHWLHCYDAPGDYLFQLTGRKILDQAGVERVHNYNLYQASNCSLLAIKMVIGHLRTDQDATIGGVSTATHWEYHSERRTIGDAILGDGAAVLLLEKGAERFTFDSFALKTIGKYNDVAAFKVGGFLEELNAKAIQEGRFKFTLVNPAHYEEVKARTVDVACEVADKALAEAGLSRGDVETLVLHCQTPSVSQRFIEAFGIDEARVIESVHDHGYMCSAGLLLSLEQFVHQRQPAPGSKALVTSLGIDGNWSAAVITV